MSFENNDQPPQQNNQQPLKKKKSRGRQKIKIEKIQNPEHLQVTFSKRKAGLFKKASELCTLCGAELAVFLFSPANKPYCFGHPSVEAITQRYQGLNINNNADPIDQRCDAIIEAHRTSNIRGLNSELTSIDSMLRAEKVQEEALEMEKKIGRAQKWFPPPLEELSYSELCSLRASVLTFKYDMAQKVTETKKKEAINAAAANAVPGYTTVITSTAAANPETRLDENSTRVVSIFDVNNSPSVLHQSSSTYAPPPPPPQVPPYDDVNVLPPFAPNVGSSDDLGLGIFYSGFFETGESSQHRHQAPTDDQVPLACYGDATDASHHYNTTGLRAYDQRMIGGFGHVPSDINQNYEGFGISNFGNYGDRYRDDMNAGGSDTFLAASSINAPGLNDQLHFDPNNLGGADYQVTFDPNSLGGANPQVTFDPNNNTGHGSVDGNGAFGADGTF